MIRARLQRLLSADAIGLALVLFALQTLAYGISSSLRNTNTQSFFVVCLPGALIAFGLSKRGVSSHAALVSMIALGIIGVWILGARLALPLISFAKALLTILPQIIPAIQFELPIDTTAVVEAWLIVVQASGALSLRLQTWVMSLNGNVTVNDPLVRNMIWILILWLLAAWMGWFAGRRNAMAALLPSMLLLAAITSYSEHKVYTLWGMMLILLVLMGIWNYKNHTVMWERRRVDYSDSILYDVGQAIVFLTLVIGALAFMTPSISWRELRDFLRERNQNEIAETLGVQQQQVPARNVPAQKPILPRDHLLMGGNALSEEIVMTIRTGELPPVVNPLLTANAPRYYWRSTTYDLYMGAGWLTSFAPAQRYEPNTPLIPGLLNGYRTLHLDVAMAQPEGRLFWSGILFSADVPVTGNWRLKPASNLFADQSALLEADMFAVTSKATAYRADSYVPLVTVEELRTASTDYPENIITSYLSLPTSVPERVLQLALEITRNEPTAYDKAKAIEAYLRAYPYDLEVPAPPQDRDVADYFLFDLKKGYCDYYATAMVVLARAGGLPARFVSGYAPGDYDAANAAYVVREQNAHSWPEIYFPEIGWIEFEPTAAQPEIELPPSKAESVAAEPDPSATQLLSRFRLEQFLYWFSPFAVLLLGAGLYFTLMERWLYLRLAPADAVEKIYRRLYRLGRPLAGERTRAETAYEFRQKLVHQIDAVKARPRFADSLHDAQKEIDLLTQMYQGTLFARSTLDPNHTRIALTIWKRLRRRLILARLLNHVRTKLAKQSLRRWNKKVVSSGSAE